MNGVAELEIPWAQTFFMEPGDYERIADLACIVGGEQLALTEMRGHGGAMCLVPSWAASFMVTVDYVAAGYHRDATTFFYRSQAPDHTLYRAIVYRRSDKRLPTFARLGDDRRSVAMFSAAWAAAVAAECELCYHDTTFANHPLTSVSAVGGRYVYQWRGADDAGYTLSVPLGARPSMEQHTLFNTRLLPQHVADFHAWRLHSWAVADEPAEFGDCQRRAPMHCTRGTQRMSPATTNTHDTARCERLLPA